ncbi:hypothetical protein IQ288_13470 [Burkholderia sp. R-69980]|nr:hypothetical protein [Burkholderia sp. R-69980]
MGRKVTIPPAQEAITVDAARAHVKADEDDDNDAILQRAIVAARERVEHELGRPLLPQTCEARFDGFSRKLSLWQDIKQVVSVSYIDDSGATVPVDPLGYYLTGGACLNMVGALPAAREVITVFECGAFAADSVPESIVEWMLLQVGAVHENRSSVDSMQTYELPGRFVDGLIDRYRFYSL